MVEPFNEECIFIRCHQSFTVNAKYVASLTSNIIFLRDNTRIPVSRNKQSRTKEIFVKYIESVG